MSVFRRFSVGFLMGLTATPLLGATVALCESPSFSRNIPGTGAAQHISADGQINHLFDNDVPPTREELEYVKTWGVRWVNDWDLPGMRGMDALSRQGYRRQIILIRHGQYENEGSHDDTIRRLTPLGEEQARRTGEYLSQSFAQAEKRNAAIAAHTAASMACRAAAKNAETSDEELAQLRDEYYRTDAQWRSQGGIFVASSPRLIHVSDMTRAKQTANLILEAFPPSVQRSLAVDPGLRERYPCDTEPRRSHSPAAAKDMKEAEDMFEKYFHRPLTGESSVEIIVGHANVIRYWTLRALQLPPEAWLRFSLPHCSITMITFNGSGEVSVSGIGSYSHLQPEQVTTRNFRGAATPSPPQISPLS